MSVTTELNIRRVTAAIGAVVDGVDLGGHFADADIEGLRAVVHRHQVVFFRDQHLDEERHRALAERFGPLAVHPVAALAGNRRTMSVITDTPERPPAGFDWHTDLSWTAEPPDLAFLAALEIPEYGGDTLWASGGAMYDRLDAHEQRRLRRLRVVHRVDEVLLRSVRNHHGNALAERLLARFPPVEQPLVRAHRATGRLSLWLSPLYTRSIVGLGDADSARLLRRLDRLADDAAVQVRWRWRAGDLALWDETSTCHRALADHHPQRRSMRRCTTAGVAPVAAADATDRPGSTALMGDRYGPAHERSGG